MKNINFYHFAIFCNSSALAKIFDFYSVFEGFESFDSLNFEDDVFEN
ncbi:ATP-binding protein, partial [Campylobacter coli]|nr:ATP-binding protein [Campylobacter coli]